ncbi:MAG: hypothetical protein PHS17_05920 [Desulfobacterales bacterium]|nr:hypothetical protein [Desulfobacterales bacterium]
MFGIILISVFTLMHAYVFWRIATVPAVAEHLSRRVIIGAAVVLWTLTKG